MTGPRPRQLRVGAIGALVAVVAGAGVAMELAFVVSQPGEIPPYRVVSFLYTPPALIAYTVVALAVVNREPRHPIAWLLGVIVLVGCSGLLLNGYTAWALPGSDWIAWVNAMAGVPFFGSLALMLLLFPTGRPPSSRWRPLLWAELVFVGAAVLVAMVGRWELLSYPNDTFMNSNPVGWVGGPLTDEDFESLNAIGALLIIASVVSLVVRWRRTRGGVERQQIKWLALAGLVVGAEMFFVPLDLVLVLLGAPNPVEGTDAGSYLIGDGLFTLAVTTLPVAMGLAITRYRLYDVDRLISRTIAYGALAVIIVAVYVIGVAAVGNAVAGGRTTTALGLAVTVAVVLAFHPLRGWLEMRADRWVFGARTAPYVLVTRFERALGLALGPDATIDRIAAAAGTAVRADAVRVTLVLPGRSALVGEWGRPWDGRPVDVTFPMESGGREFGAIDVAGPSGRRDDLRVLRSIAGIATTALRNVRLDATLEFLAQTIETQNRDLATSQRRLIVAADTERRHLQDAINRRVEPRLNGLRDGLPHLRNLAEQRSVMVDQARDVLVAEATLLVDEIRAVSRGVLPPVLADHGVAAGVRALLRRLDLDTTLAEDPALEGRRFGAPVESAVYLGCRTVVLALADASGGAPVEVALWLRDERLRFTISTAGSPVTVPAGHELTVADDRISALGGTLEIATTERMVTANGAVPLLSDSLAEVGEDGADPAMDALLLGDTELLEDRADVLLDGAEPHAQVRTDGRVAHALGHRLEDLALAEREPLER
jgi:hypothetical protein